MATRLFALITGIFLTVMGILALLPAFLWEPSMPRLRMDYIYFDPGYLAGFIPVNLPHNILWIIMGVGGIVASLTYVSSKLYSQGLFALSFLLLFVGILPLGIGSLWGFLPLFSWNVFIHSLLAMLAWYYGYVYTYGRELRMAQ